MRHQLIAPLCKLHIEVACLAGLAHGTAEHIQVSRLFQLEESVSRDLICSS